ncbi:MAG: hypothetical protein K1X36_12220 [Pyrinomonadaceae bacterium]|nr:hypothetical protein [Pyrinomonadaceae bacterium]
MRNSIIAFSLLFVLSLFSAQTGLATVSSEDSVIGGKWSLVADAGGQTIQILVDFKQTGSDFTGTTSSDMGNGTIDAGKVTGKTFTGVLHADIQGNVVDFKIDGTIDGDKMTGTFTNPSFGSIPFSATRNK